MTKPEKKMNESKMEKLDFDRYLLNIHLEEHPPWEIQTVDVLETTIE